MAQQNATNHIIAAESDRVCERVELLDVRVSESNGESVLEFPHAFEHRHRDRVVWRELCPERANKPQALSTQLARPITR
jgi:hypothetical protein